MSEAGSGVAEAPVFGTTTVWHGSEEAGITLAGLSATGDADDALSATISGIPTGWSVRDGTVALSNGQGVAASDLGRLGWSGPDNGGESRLLRVAGGTGEGGGARAVETLSVTASGAAETPSFGTTTSWSGGAGVTLAGLSATGDSDDMLSATFTGLSAGWTLVDSHSGASFTGTS